MCSSMHRGRATIPLENRVDEQHCHTFEGRPTPSRPASRASLVTDCSPYWTGKANTFQGNVYYVPSAATKSWVLSSACSWAAWRAVGFDTTGSITWATSA